jgi:hypothetical protein
MTSNVDWTAVQHLGISDIRLYTDETSIVVEVKAVDKWVEVIREPRRASSIDHFITAEGIRQLYIKQG